MHKFQSDPARVRRLLRAEGTEMTKDARKRLQWFVYCLEHDGNFSLTCRYFGIARSTFVRWAERFDPLDPATLEEHSRRPRHFREPETPEATVALIKSLREQNPHMNRAEIMRVLQERHGMTISSASVGRVIRRYALFFADTPSHARKRREIEPPAFPSAVSDHCPEGEEHRGEAEDGFAFAPPATLAVLFTVTSLLLGGVLVPRHVFAADSDDFSLNEDTSSISESAVESDSYQIDDASVTWDDSTGESESYSQGSPDPDPGSDDTGGGTGGSGGGGSGAGEGATGGSQGGGRRTVSGDTAAASGDAPSGVPSVVPSGTQTPSHAATVTGAKDARNPGRIESPFASAVRIDASPSGFHRPATTALRDSPYNFAASLPHFFALTDSAQVAYGPKVQVASGIDLRNAAMQYAASVRRDIALLGANVVTYATLIGGYFVIRTQPMLLISEDLLAAALRAGKHKLPYSARRRKKQKAIRKTKKKRVTSKRNAHVRSVLPFIVAISIVAATIGVVPVRAANTTVPQKIIYNGQLKNKQGQAITTNHLMRFSFWSDADAVPADLLADGTIDTSRPNYAGWQEVHVIKPNSSGYFSANLGSGTALPALSGMTTYQLLNLHMQVEVKQVGQADTAYQIMDVNPSPVIDRTPLRSVPFALNSDLFDQRDTGTGSGNIAVLGPGGVYASAQIPGGTNSGSFVIDKDNSEASTVKLQFGQSLGKALSYDIGAGLFNFNDDVRIQGDLTVTGFINGVTINALVSPLKVVSSGAGLNVNIASGSYRLNGDITNYPGQEDLILNDNTTNYLSFGSGGLKVSTLSFPVDESAIPLAEIVTSGGSITAVSDRRILQSDDRGRSVAERYSAGFEHVVFQGDAASNVGQLSEGHDGINQKNYYQWTSTMGTLQDYDVIVRVPISEDFTGWLDNPLQVQYRSTSADSANAKLDVTVFDTNGSPVTLSGSTTNLAGTSWSTTQIEFTGSPTWTPATEFLMKFKVSAKDTFQIHLGGFLLRFSELLTD